MKKHILTLTVLTALALTNTAHATNPKQLTWDETGCTPQMSFTAGTTYHVNSKQHFNEVVGGTDNFDEAFGWVFVLPAQYAKNVKFNGKFAVSDDGDTASAVAYPNHDNNRINIVKSFYGSICFNGAG